MDCFAWDHKPFRSRSNSTASEFSRKIGVLGGSFDPPTRGHFNIIKELLSRGIVDLMVMVPCGRRPDKNSSDPEHRHQMTVIGSTISLASSRQFRVSDIETSRPEGFMPTYSMMVELQKQFPNDDLMFIIGTDLLPSLYKWENGKLLLEEVHFILLERAGYNITYTTQNHYPQRYLLIRLDEHNIGNCSSTQVRQLVRDYHAAYQERLESVNYFYDRIVELISRRVFKFILQNRLYIDMEGQGSEFREIPEIQ